MSPKVYVVQNALHYSPKTRGLVPKFDLSAAHEYGEIIELLSPNAGPFSLETILPELHDKLSNFRSDDFLLLIGNPVLIGLSMSIAALYNHGDMTVLQWSGKEQGYLPIAVEGVFGPEFSFEGAMS